MAVRHLWRRRWGFVLGFAALTPTYGSAQPTAEGGLFGEGKDLGPGPIIEVPKQLNANLHRHLGGVRLRHGPGDSDESVGVTAI